MQLPIINAKSDSVTMVNSFLGLNRNAYLSEQEFADMVNLTNDNYPVIANRKVRGIIKTLSASEHDSAAGGKCLAYTNNNKLYYDGSIVANLKAFTEAQWDAMPTDNKRRNVVVMGAYICVFPDNIMVNLENVGEGQVSLDHKCELANITFKLTTLDGEMYDADNTVTSKNAPEDTSKYWIDTSVNPVTLRAYSEAQGMWVSVGTTYVRLESSNATAFEWVSKYDAVKISGITNGTWIYNQCDFNTTNVVYDCGGNYITIAGFINKVHTQSAKITFEREIPYMDYVVEHENRLWGCSTIKHEIYACKQGDPKNWYRYAGLDDDSYAATVGTQNRFTGAVSYGGYVMFFKEDGFHKVYGNKPSNFQISWQQGRGVQFGSERSISVCNGALLFKARDGVCLYDGSTQVVSRNLGQINYYEAVAGNYREKYYISMRDDDMRYRLFVYDTAKGTWVVEEDTRVEWFAYSTNGLYMLKDNEDGTGTLCNINSEAIMSKIFPSGTLFPSDETYCGNSVNGQIEGNVEWLLETGDIGMDTPFHKYVKRIVLRILLDTNAKLNIEVMYDSSDDWTKIMEYTATTKRSYEIPVIVQRCDHFRLRLSGFGNFKLFSIAKIVEEGSET